MTEVQTIPVKDLVGWYNERKALLREDINARRQAGDLEPDQDPGESLRVTSRLRGRRDELADFVGFLAARMADASGQLDTVPDDIADDKG